MALVLASFCGEPHKQNERFVTPSTAHTAWACQLPAQTPVQHVPRCIRQSMSDGLSTAGACMCRPCAHAGLQFNSLWWCKWRICAVCAHGLGKIPRHSLVSPHVSPPRLVTRVRHTRRILLIVPLATSLRTLLKPQTRLCFHKPWPCTPARPHAGANDRLVRWEVLPSGGCVSHALLAEHGPPAWLLAMSEAVIWRCHGLT